PRPPRSPLFPYTTLFRSLPPLLLCLALTEYQLAYWHDSIALFSQAINVTRNNAIAEHNLGVALANAGRSAEAIEHYRKALRVKRSEEHTSELQSRGHLVC